MGKWKKELVRYLFPYSAQNLQIERAFFLKNPHVPQRLYKYRSFCEEHKDALTRNILWRCSPDKFNDPYDSSVYFNVDKLLMEDRSPEDILRTVEMASDESPLRRPAPLKKAVSFGDWRRKLLAETIATATDKNGETLGLFESIEVAVRCQNKRLTFYLTERFQSAFSVVSLSEISSSILMWSHYSGAHCGFCIEYDFSSLSPEDLRRRLCFPVYYREKLTNATRYLAHADTANLNNLFGLYLSLLKGDEWAYEKEWRIVYPAGPTHANAEISMPTPSAIILGIRADSADEEWVVEYCNRTNIPLMKMRQRRDVFRLEVAPYAY